MLGAAKDAGITPNWKNRRKGAVSRRAVRRQRGEKGKPTTPASEAHNAPLWPHRGNREEAPKWRLIPSG